MNDMPSEIGCPECGAYGFGCDCDRSRLLEMCAAKQRRGPPPNAVAFWPYLPADAVARLGQQRPAEFVREPGELSGPTQGDEVARRSRRAIAGTRRGRTACPAGRMVGLAGIASQRRNVMIKFPRRMGPSSLMAGAVVVTSCCAVMLHTLTGNHEAAGLWLIAAGIWSLVGLHD